MREDRMYLREEMVALKADVLTMREEARNSQTEMREDMAAMQTEMREGFAQLSEEAWSSRTEEYRRLDRRCSSRCLVTLPIS